MFYKNSRFSQIRICFTIYIFAISVVSIFCQNTKPAKIETCLARNIDQCFCFKKLLTESIDNSILAYCHYYLAYDSCDSTSVEEKKHHFSKARENWDEINYKSFRYSFTYMYWVQHYSFIDFNADSIKHYYLKQFQFDSIEDVDVQYNLIESFRLLELSLLRSGDYKAIISICENFENSNWYDNLSQLNLSTYYHYKADAYIETPIKSLIEKGRQANYQSLNTLKSNPDLANSSKIYFILYSIARSYEKEGNYKLAYSEFKKSLDYLLDNNSQKISTEGFLSPNFSEANNLDALAELALLNKEYKEAIYYANKSIQAFQLDSFINLNEARPYISLAKAHSKLGQFDLANYVLDKAITIAAEDSLVKDIIYDSLSIKTSYSPIELIRSTTAKARNYIDLAKSNKNTFSTEADILNKLSNRLFNEYIDNLENKTSKYWNRSLHDEIFKTGFENILIEGDSKHAFNYTEQNKQTIETKQEAIPLQDGPKNHQILQYYFTFDSLICITKLENQYKTNYLASKEHISDLIDSLTKNLIHNISSQEIQKELYKILILPLDLKQNKPIHIIADGVLHKLPFEQLIDLEDQFLVTNYIFNYQLSYSQQLNSQSKKYVNDSIGIINPEYTERANSTESISREVKIEPGIFNLKYSREETRAILKLSKLAKQIKTQKSKIVSRFKNYKIIHFAGHAISNSIDPDKAFLALNSEIGKKTNRLEFSEIQNIGIKNDLIILSACETSVGLVIEGEGPLSLARGFLYAGAKSVISTLWSVNDKSTSIIMTEFYKELLKGKRKDEALRQAKLAYLDKADPEYQHPFYWAGFIAMGDMSPLFFPYRKWYYLGFGFLALVILGLIYKKKVSLNRLAA